MAYCGHSKEIEAFATIFSGNFRNMKPQWRLLIPALVANFCVLSVPAAATAADRAPECSYPAEVLNLESWKVTLPTGSEGDPTEITQPDLAEFSEDPWFVPNETCDGIRFRAPVNGVTTSGSSYPRSELREMTDDGSDEASWSNTSGTHTMEIDTAVTHLPQDKEHIVVGQIHGGDDDVTVFRLEGSKLYVTKGDDSNYALVTDDYKPGTRFKAKFVATDGKIDAYYNGNLAATVEVESETSYFKAGAYTQANCENSDPCEAGNYGEAVLYGLNISHED